MTLWRATARPLRALALVLALGLGLVGSATVAPNATGQSASPGVGEAEIPPAVGFVNDRAELLDEPTRARLEAFLDQVKRKTGAEFAVLTVRTTAPLTPSEYKVKVFERWGLGKHGEDNGLLLLLALEEREAWFETGYGLEGILPDGLEARIVREQMSPRFREGDYVGCIEAGVLAAAARLAADKGVTLEWDGHELRYDRPSSRRGPWWLPLLIFLLVLIVMSRMRGLSTRRRGFWGPYWGGGFGGGWGGGWGGGFGGGGGGGSFGGFGGGASGGGGGGGHL